MGGFDGACHDGLRFFGWRLAFVVRLRHFAVSLQELAPVDGARQPCELNEAIAFLEKDPRKLTKGLVPFAEALVPFAEALCSQADDLDPLAEVPFVLPHDLCVGPADLVMPVDDPRCLRRDLFLLAELRRQHAKALFGLAEDLCRLSEDLLSFTECGCQMYEVLCAPAMALRQLAKDLCRVSEDLVLVTAGLHQVTEGLSPWREAFAKKSTDVRRKPKDLCSLAKAICRDSTVLVQRTTVLYQGTTALYHGTTILFRVNKGHSVFSKSSALRSKRISRVSMPLRLDSEDPFVELEGLCRRAAARRATNLVPPISLIGYGAISSDGERQLVGGGAPPSGAGALEARGAVVSGCVGASGALGAAFSPTVRAETKRAAETFQCHFTWLPPMGSRDRSPPRTAAPIGVTASWAA